MKKTILFGILFSLTYSSSVYSSNMAKGDTSFAGVIIYELTYTAQEGVMVDAQRLALQAKEAELLFSGNIARLTQDGIQLKQIRYIDGYQKTTTDILHIKHDVYGKNTLYGGIKKGFKDIQVELAKTQPPQVNYTNETKVIEDLTCKKAEITTWDEFGFENKSEVWFYEHPQLAQLNFYSDFRAISGLLMEFNIVSQGVIIHYKTKSFKKKKKIKNTEFQIPEGVEFFTLEELNKINERGYE